MSMTWYEYFALTEKVVLFGLGITCFIGFIGCILHGLEKSHPPSFVYGALLLVLEWFIAKKI